MDHLWSLESCSYPSGRKFCAFSYNLSYNLAIEADASGIPGILSTKELPIGNMFFIYLNS